MRYFFWLLTLFLLPEIKGQQTLPVIRSTSKNVKIWDGLNFKSNYWVIFPETKPDVYYTDIPRKITEVKFITDIDSISFPLSFGETKDFIVLLNGKDSCFTRISANYPRLRTPSKSKPGNDTIPFTLRNNRIYFKGKINGSALLNFQFDLGADAVNINKNSIRKTRIRFDKKGNLLNSQGTNETRVSSSNVLEVGGLTWQDIEIYETGNMNNFEDAIIGNGFFLDRVYKIDYDHRILILYHEKPEIEADYVKQPMILDNGVRPVFEAVFKLENKEFRDWFLFDTGNAGNGILGSSFLTKNNLYKKFSYLINLGNTKVAFVPQLNIANQTLTKGVITLENHKKKGSEFKCGGLVGNKILKRFNVIIDNREGNLYLKQNLLGNKKP
jgi:hypothetical protein